jgi:hypothetical protein
MIYPNRSIFSHFSGIDDLENAADVNVNDFVAEHESLRKLWVLEIKADSESISDAGGTNPVKSITTHLPRRSDAVATTAFRTMCAAIGNRFLILYGCESP